MNTVTVSQGTTELTKSTITDHIINLMQKKVHDKLRTKSRHLNKRADKQAVLPVQHYVEHVKHSSSPSGVGEDAALEAAGVGEDAASEAAGVGEDDAALLAGPADEGDAALVALRRNARARISAVTSTKRSIVGPRCAVPLPPSLACSPAAGFGGRCGLRRRRGPMRAGGGDGARAALGCCLLGLYFGKSVYQIQRNKWEIHYIYAWDPNRWFFFLFQKLLLYQYY